MTPVSISDIGRAIWCGLGQLTQPRRSWRGQETLLPLTLEGSTTTARRNRSLCDRRRGIAAVRSIDGPSQTSAQDSRTQHSAITRDHELLPLPGRVLGWLPAGDLPDRVGPERHDRPANAFPRSARPGWRSVDEARVAYRSKGECVLQLIRLRLIEGRIEIMRNPIAKLVHEQPGRTSCRID